jgi:hypothetical protein
LHIEELHNLFSSPNIMMIKSRTRWAGHVACIRAMKSVYRILVGNPEGKEPLGRLGTDGRIIFVDLSKIDLEGVNKLRSRVRGSS